MDLAAFFRRRGTGRGKRRASQPTTRRGASLFETLELRALLTTFYVDNNLVLTADRDASGGLSPGDQVTFGSGQAYQQADLTYDAAPSDGDVGTAFSSISQAVASPLVQAGDTIDIAGGTYTESVTIDKSLTLQGEGNVVLQSPTAGGAVATMTISGNPDNVTLDNLDLASPSYSAGLADNGGDTLNLIDVIGVDTFSIVDVTNLNIARTKNASQQVRITPFDPGAVGYVTDNLPFPSAAPVFNSAFTGEVYFQDRTNIDFQATNLSVSTGAGDDSFNVTPILKTTVTIDGGDPNPPALPGNSLIVLGENPNELTFTKSASGYAGTWTSPYAEPVNFSHIESLSPGEFVERKQGISDLAAGQSFNGAVLGFDDPSTNLPLSDYNAAIDWGDGQTSAGTVVAGGDYGTFAVRGSHTYASAGEFPITVAISRPGTFDTALTATAVVFDAAPVGSGVTLSATAGQAIGTATSGSGALSAVVGTFFDPGSNVSNADDFTATVVWGDGSSSTGTVQPLAGGGADQWQVSGSHVYTTDGNYQINVIVDTTFADPFVSITSKANVAKENNSQATSTTFYVDNNLQLTADRDASGGLSLGDQVTFGNGQGYQQVDLTYDAAPVDGDVGVAFSSISQALGSLLVQPGDTIEIAGGEYIESVTIDKSITLQGEGNVVIEPPNGMGVVINNHPDNVTLADLDIEGFHSSISTAGVGTLNLIDLALGTVFGSMFADPSNQVANVTNLNIVATLNQLATVSLNVGPPMGLIPFFQIEGNASSYAIAVDNVTNITVTTGGGRDTFNVAPIAKSITIDAGDPTPPAQPGDSLNVWFPSYSGNSLAVTKDASGYSGTWSFNGGDTVHFSHIETLSPGVLVQGNQTITATEGLDTGKVLLAQFTDPLGNLPLNDYSADIDWTDGTTSNGTVSYDSTTDVYSVYADHVFGEPHVDQLKIVIHRVGSPDTTTYATATVTPTPNQQYVATVYQILLDRIADPAGVAYWSGQLDAGLSRNQFVSGVEASSEYRHEVVNTLYQRYLHRAAEPLALDADTSLLAAGITDEQLATIIVGSDEYFALNGGTNDGFLNALFEEVFLRPIDAGAKTVFEHDLAAGATRAQVSAVVFGSHEYHTDLVSSLYFQWLGRSADAAGSAYWASQLDSGATGEQVLAAIAASDEFFKRP